MTTNARKIGRPATGKKPSLQVSVEPELMEWIQDEAAKIGVSASMMARIILHKSKAGQ